ncbi:MAG: rRNA maturation RNase YbeY, partial [Oscillospiraceae bacterium]|nr:rRNA maturation RNase YbeY [Oscillospiraceae bacterium]
MGKLRVFITNNQHVVKIPSGIRFLIRRCCHAVLSLEGIDNDTEISVSFVDNRKIKELNAKYRNKNVETDVLSFPLGDSNGFNIDEDGVLLLGDIVISFEKAKQQA